MYLYCSYDYYSLDSPVLLPLMQLEYEKVYLLQNTTNLSGSEVISTYVYKVGWNRQISPLVRQRIFSTP